MQSTTKVRHHPDSNYRAVWLNGKTIRLPIAISKPVTELKFPEFYDVAINSWCSANCPECYTAATKNGKHFGSITNKIIQYFGVMSPNERPFQVALGGAGEPTAHPQFVDVLRVFDHLGIVPNYTTNGMHLNKETIEATKKYCGGVAVSLHPHLETTWRKAIELLLENGIKTNVHIIISDQESIDFFKRIYDEYCGRIDYFVLLAYIPIGRAAPKDISYEYLEKTLDKIPNRGNVAFSSKFYDFLKAKKHKYDVSIYPPEILSKYLVMDDDMKLYNNSFEMKEVT